MQMSLFSVLFFLIYIFENRPYFLVIEKITCNFHFTFGRIYKLRLYTEFQVFQFDNKNVFICIIFKSKYLAKQMTYHKGVNHQYPTIIPNLFRLHFKLIQFGQPALGSKYTSECFFENLSYMLIPPSHSQSVLRISFRIFLGKWFD